MARIAVVGRGQLGSAVAAALTAAGAEAVLLSRANGFDVSGPVSFKPHGAFDAVVEATDVVTTSARAATDFFVASTTHIADAASEAGINLHVLVSIVGCTTPALAGLGYYAGKAAQERAFLGHDQSAGRVLVRSTQWHEYARQSSSRMRLGPVIVVPSTRVRPVALDAVAHVVAKRSLGARTGDVIDIAGPDETTLWAMTQALPDLRGLLVPLRVPGKAGRALHGGALLPGPGAEIVGPTFDEWVTAGRH